VSAVVDDETKWRRILRFLARGGRLTRFDAEKLGDHALNSTVSNLQAMGIEIAREPLILEGRFGRIHCKRYWLSADQRDRARRLLGRI
jgi:hypothetical protein